MKTHTMKYTQHLGLLYVCRSFFSASHLDAAQTLDSDETVNVTLNSRIDVDCEVYVVILGLKIWFW